MSNFENNEIEKSGADEKKPSYYARFKKFLSDRKAKKAAEIPLAEPKPELHTQADISEFFVTVESQLGNLDAQNKLLLSQMSRLQQNNDMLMDHVKILTKNNDELQKQFIISKRREKISKIIAIVSSALAIGLTIYKFLQILKVVP